MESGATAASSGKCYHVENTLVFTVCKKHSNFPVSISVYTEYIF